jgi:catechol-2,3-dioxygenase
LQADVVVYNVWGQIVFKQIFEQKIGFNKVAFDLNKTFLATGIYHFILNSGKESHAVKLIKK